MSPSTTASQAEMNLNPSGASPATAAKSGGSHRDSEKSSKRMQLE